MNDRDDTFQDVGWLNDAFAADGDPGFVREFRAWVEKGEKTQRPPGFVRRVDRWPILPEALREIVINSVIHADYSQIGGPLRLALSDDRLEVENPGLLPAGVTIEDMKQGISKPRRPLPHGQ